MGAYCIDPVFIAHQEGIGRPISTEKHTPRSQEIECIAKRFKEIVRIIEILYLPSAEVALQIGLHGGQIYGFLIPSMTAVGDDEGHFWEISSHGIDILGLRVHRLQWGGFTA